MTTTTSNKIAISYANGVTKEYTTPLLLDSLKDDDDFAIDIPDRENSNKLVLNTGSDNPIVAARVNNLVTNLSTSISFSKAHVEPIYESSVVGNEIVRHTMLYVLSMALCELYPKHVFTAEHHIGFGYMMQSDSLDLSDAIIAAIQGKMQELADANLPIRETIMSHEEAVAYFESINRPYTKALLERMNEPVVRVDKCTNALAYYDIHTRTLGASTSVIKGKFTLQLRADNTFVLNFPPDTYLLHYTYDDSEIAKVYREANTWGKWFSLECVGELCSIIREKKIREVILKNHALHDKKISQVANAIAQKKALVVLIAGPSASGKTTSALKLAIQLEILGMQPVVFSVDNYYKPHEECPKNDQGQYDFESMDALRVELLNQHLITLLKGEEVETPIFNFKMGKPELKGKKMKLPKRAPVLILEGIHCLNPSLTPNIPMHQKYKIFIAPLMQLNVSEFNFISSTRTRLLRRMVRDYATRGHQVQATLTMWPSVREGEHKHIFPYIVHADSILDTSLDYEFCAIKVIAKPLLQAVKPSDKFYNISRELIQFLSLFDTILHNDIPTDSLLREFIGGSFFETV